MIRRARRCRFLNRLRRLSWNGHCEFTIVPLRRPVNSSAAVARRRRKRGYGSATNASDAVDAPVIEPGDSADEVLDVAVEYTFPASDPISVEQAYKARLRRLTPT
jgi:hypothetical protein